jgi:hypothetical protein
MDRKRYQTRIVSTADKVNLKFEEALPQMVEGLVRSIFLVFLKSEICMSKRMFAN